MIKNISFITAHFYDFDWTTLLVKNITRFTDDQLVKEILIINQDRTVESREKLQALHPKVRVLEYPVSELHYKLQWHDHAHVLNLSLAEAVGDYVCIFDSDAHPINEKWIGLCEEIFRYYDAILALQPGRVMLTHPCFMFMKNTDLKNILRFDEDLLEKGTDVGRKVGIQLINQGKKVYMAGSRDAFHGQWGHTYLDVIYHHQSGSFRGSKEREIQKRIKWQIGFFKGVVVKRGIYKFTPLLLLKYILYRIFHSFLQC